MNHPMEITIYCPECDKELSHSTSGFEYSECINPYCTLEGIKFIVPNIQLKRLIEYRGDEVCH